MLLFLRVVSVVSKGAFSYYEVYHVFNFTGFIVDVVFQRITSSATAAAYACRLRALVLGLREGLFIQ